MEGIIKHKTFISLIALLLLASISFIGCNDDGGGGSTQDTQALTESDFANNDNLRGDPEGGVIVTFLEHPDSEIPENDTGEVGVDQIPLTYAQTLEHTICWEDQDVDAMHFMELLDSEGNEILRVDVNGECVTEAIEAGNYVMVIHHDGRMETSYPIFIIPNPEDMEQARETDGLINKLKMVAVNILKGIQKTVTKDAEAQTVQQNINTLLSTNNCVGCDLENANLFRARLSGANLSFATMELANLRRANLSDANLSDANLRNARLGDANLSRANFTNANLNGADLIGANLRNADLRSADLSGAHLMIADLIGANLSGANLSGANLSDAHLSGATWCDGSCMCADPSTGTCVGCASVEEVCTGS